MVRHMDTEMTLMKQEDVTHSSLETEGMAYGRGLWQSIIVSLVAEGTQVGGGGRQAESLLRFLWEGTG